MGEEYPDLWGDTSAFEPITAFDYFQWLVGFAIFGWNIILGPVLYPYLSGQ